MMWKCSLTVVFGDDRDPDVVTEERTASDPRIGLDLVWTRCKQQMSLLSIDKDPRRAAVQVLGWCDPIYNTDQALNQKLQQKLLDTAVSKEEELEMARLLSLEPTELGSREASENPS